jgi:hypothetical protein
VGWTEQRCVYANEDGGLFEDNADAAIDRLDALLRASVTK